MKFRMFVVGASAATLASLAAMTACSGSDTPATTSGGATVPAPTGGATASTDRQVFAASKVFLGDTDRNGTLDDQAWRKFGYDLDDKRTTANSKDVCLPSAGGPPVPDGNNGIDNAFGEKVLGLLIGAGVSTPTQTTQEAVNSGDFTLMFDFTGLTTDAKQSNTGLKGQVLVPGPYGSAPNFADGMNVDFQVRSNLLEGNDPANSKIKFTQVYVNNGLLVAKADSIDLTLAVAGVNATFAIKNAVVTANHATPTTLTGGTITGVLEIGRLKSLIGEIGSKLTKELCPGSGQLKIVNEALASSGDIMVSGPNNGGVCDGISIALGFEAVQVKAPTKVYVPTGNTEPEKDLCAEAADGGASDASAPKTDAGSDAN